MYDHSGPHVSSNGASHNGSNGSGSSSSHAPSGSVEASPFSELLLHPSLGARRITVAAGKVLYDTSTEARYLYFIHRGQVRTYRVDEDANGRLLEILGPDDWCGEASLARQPQYGEQAIAVVSTVVSEVPAERFVAMLGQHPKAAVELMKQLANKLSAARADAAGLVFEDCHSRLLKTLVRFSHSAAATPHPEGVILRITHQQLAQAVGVARETVSLALTQLRQANLLRTGRNQLMFNPESLRSFARTHREPREDAVINEG